MSDTTDIEIADHLARRRARAATVFAILFIVSMATSFDTGDLPGRPAKLHIAASVIWAAVLLFLLAVGGGMGRGRSVRVLMNDESTRVNRREAMATGFWAAVFASFGLYGLNLFMPLAAGDAIRLILSALVSAALLRFGALEQRSLRGE